MITWMPGRTRHPRSSSWDHSGSSDFGAVSPHPQLCPPPALTEMNSPWGGVASPSALWPQQTMVPSAFTPARNTGTRGDSIVNIDLS